MTIINNKYKFIFIHIPKNAGTSIANFFSLYNTPIDIEIGGTKIGEMLQAEYLSRYGVGKHSSAEKLAFKLSFIWDEYYKFAVVRNPYTRFMSAYNFLKKWSGPQNHLIAEVMTRHTRLEQFIDFMKGAEPGFADNMFLPQSDWVCNEKGLIINKLVKFENLQDDLSQVIKDIRHQEANPILLKKLNSGDRLDSEKYLFSKQYIQFINQYYESDFDNFYYDKL